MKHWVRWVAAVTVLTATAAGYPTDWGGTDLPEPPQVIRTVTDAVTPRVAEPPPVTATTVAAGQATPAVPSPAARQMPERWDWDQGLLPADRVPNPDWIPECEGQPVNTTVLYRYETQFGSGYWSVRCEPHRYGQYRPTRPTCTVPAPDPAWGVSRAGTSCGHRTFGYWGETLRDGKTWGPANKITGVSWEPTNTLGWMSPTQCEAMWRWVRDHRWVDDPMYPPSDLRQATAALDESRCAWGGRANGFRTDPACLGPNRIAYHTNYVLNQSCDRARVTGFAGYQAKSVQTRRSVSVGADWECLEPGCRPNQWHRQIGQWAHLGGGESACGQSSYRHRAGKDTKVLGYAGWEVRVSQRWGVASEHTNANCNFRGEVTWHTQAIWDATVRSPEGVRYRMVWAPPVDIHEPAHTQSYDVRWVAVNRTMVCVPTGGRVTPVRVLPVTDLDVTRGAYVSYQRCPQTHRESRASDTGKLTLTFWWGYKLFENRQAVAETVTVDGEPMVPHTVTVDGGFRVWADLKTER